MMTAPSLTEVHERLVRLGSEPVSDADAAWQDLRRKLSDRPLSWSGRLMAWLRRPAIAIMTAGLLSTGIAHAAGVQPVRRGVDWLIGGVTSIVGAKNEPRRERATRPRQGQSDFRQGAGSWEENRRRLVGGAGVESDQEWDAAGGGRGLAPTPGAAGSGGDEDRDEPREYDDDERGDDDDEREDDDDEREDDDGDDEGRSEPDDEEAEETEEFDDQELEEDLSDEAEERDEMERERHNEIDQKGDL